MNDVEESGPRRLTRAETKARTRARLLDAAAQVFARKGFGGASVDEIAESAGYSTGALYSNFGGKDELFLELLASRTGLRQAEAAAILSGPNPDLAQVRSGLNQLLVDAADNDADTALLQAELWLYAIRRPELRGHLAARFRTNRDSLTAILAERAHARRDGEQAGEQPADDAPFEEAATVVLALFQGLAQLRRTDPDLVPADLYGRALRWLFVGLNQPADTPPEQ